MDAYKILKLSPTEAYTASDLRIAYKTALLNAHPDKQQNGRVSEISVDHVLTTERYNAVVDLDDFEEQADGSFVYPCRCGEYGGYIVTEDDLENGMDVIPCTGCSLVVKVAYEICYSD
ncbi:diphthamide biosynthesis protein Dph4 [Schizosaccharomyces japonicus yFS275]|uniref:Diphthamide biosynthesis protein 4 n=1 Tax=Schizosaccharomyces japonicus (strain yFS275 / FY16936) TaxID=402676 RepID=B6JV49_SCHJY|nr:diphthamide biosynthesis protein Dph4 [Schizosaccharomyces japonicus yFS275]EEB05250.1 diphthamide biosynthesis protein Dph4 [Schizosaccharomyces japonicus yFS275]